MLTLNRARETIVLNCCGGLGNQMFIYAAGLYFAKKLGKRLEVVKPPINQQRYRSYPRPFQLSNFQIEEQVREAHVLDRLFFSRNPSLRNLRSAFSKLLDSESISEPAEYRFHPDLHLDASRSTTYLSGYWQAAGYARLMESDLRKRLVLKVALGDRACGFAEQILKLQCPVSVHLRLGDYAQILRSTGPAGRQVTNVLSSQYYDRAILDLQKRHENVTLIVFSDEPSAARALMQEKGPCVFIEGNGTQRAHEDMWLMSLCKHHVLANSSFSWWGGWLCQTESKRMYAPRYWTNCEQSYYPDLYPVGCEVIDNLNSE